MRPGPLLVPRLTRPRAVSTLLCGLLLACAAPIGLGAQRGEDTRFGVVAMSAAITTRFDGVPHPAGDGLVHGLRPIHPLERGAGALLVAPGGAATGWLAYTLGFELLAPAHATIHRGDRERVTLALAAYALVLGWRCGWMSESLAWDCPQARPSELPLFGRPTARRPARVPAEAPPGA
jgi:hypothetical protein